MPRNRKRNYRPLWHSVCNLEQTASCAVKSPTVLSQVPPADEQKSGTTAPNISDYSMAEHSSHTMELLRRDHTHRDAVIEAEGETFKIHKSVFAIYSDYFDKVFTVEMQEKYESVVKLKDTRADVVKCIVDFIYTGQLSINRENAVELLVAADYLRIDDIKTFSVKFLLINVDTENCVRAWCCAKLYDLKELFEKSTAIFGENFMSVPHEELEMLHSDQILEMMGSCKAAKISDEISFRKITEWTKRDWETRKATFFMMFQNIDLSIFSKDFLSNIVKNESLISMSAKAMHKVVVESIARLEKASDEEDKANHRIAKLEDERFVSTQRIDRLVNEKKQLADKIHQFVNVLQQEAVVQKNVLQENASLVKQNRTLREKLQSRERKAQQSVLRHNASANIIDDLTKEIKNLTENVSTNIARAQRAECHEKTSANRVNTLTAENKRLTERFRRNASIAQQHEDQLKAANQKIDRLTKENDSLVEERMRSACDALQTERHVMELDTKIGWLMEENRRLTTEIDCFSERDENRELEIKVENLIKENQRLAMQLEIATCCSKQAASKSRELERRVEHYAEENHRLSEMAEKWPVPKFVVEKLQAVRRVIRDVINDPSILSCIWNEIFLEH